MFKSKVCFSDLEALELIGLLALCSSSPSENTGRLIHHLPAPATLWLFIQCQRLTDQKEGPMYFFKWNYKVCCYNELGSISWWRLFHSALIIIITFCNPETPRIMIILIESNITHLIKKKKGKVDAQP